MAVHNFLKQSKYERKGEITYRFIYVQVSAEIYSVTGLLTTRKCRRENTVAQPEGSVSTKWWSKDEDGRRRRRKG